MAYTCAQKIKQVAVITFGVVMVFVSTNVIVTIHSIPNQLHPTIDWSRESSFDVIPRVAVANETHEGVLCLHVHPPVGKDEFTAVKDDTEINRICPGDFKYKTAWNVNYNIERIFKFVPDVQLVDGKTRTPYFMERLGQTYGIPSPKRTSSTIPKLFHFIWTDEIIPSVFVDNLKLFRKTHPSWTIHFWTLKAGRTFLQKYEPQIVPIFDQLKTVFKTDALRYVLIFYFGGAYFDIDSKVIKPIDELAENYECILGPEPMENALMNLGKPSVLANSGFLCKQGHALFRYLIDSIPVHGRKDPGPLYITKCFNLFLNQQLSNITAVNESFEVNVVTHDYFEYTTLKGYNVDTNMKKLCVKHTTDIMDYIRVCLQTYTGKSTDKVLYTKCETLYTKYLKISKLKKMEFDGCVEWISHGAENRVPSNNRYIDHVHYGTHQEKVFTKLAFKKDNNISAILPGISFHL